MNTRLTIDKAGRVVIPKPLRKQLHLEAGDTLDVGTIGDQITLTPSRQAAPLRKEAGVWVFHTGRPLPPTLADDTLQQIREERDRSHFGKHK